LRKFRGDSLLGHKKKLPNAERWGRLFYGHRCRHRCRMALPDRTLRFAALAIASTRSPLPGVCYGGVVARSHPGTGIANVGGGVIWNGIQEVRSGGGGILCRPRIQDPRFAPVFFGLSFRYFSTPSPVCQPDKLKSSKVLKSMMV